MYAADGVGLAGPQIGVWRRLFVYDISNRKGHVINPVLTVDDPEEVVDEEGCLSVPDKRDRQPAVRPDLPRRRGDRAQGLNRLGRPVTRQGPRHARPLLPARDRPP